jgi:hypothetical protein
MARQKKLEPLDRYLDGKREQGNDHTAVMQMFERMAREGRGVKIVKLGG